MLLLNVGLWNMQNKIQIEVLVESSVLMKRIVAALEL